MKCYLDSRHLARFDPTKFTKNAADARTVNRRQLERPKHHSMGQLEATFREHSKVLSTLLWRTAITLSDFRWRILSHGQVGVPEAIITRTT